MNLNLKINKFKVMDIFPISINKIASTIMQMQSKPLMR